MNWAPIEIALFAVIACGVAILAATFPAVWRWRNVEPEIPRQLEELRQNPTASPALIDQLNEQLERRTRDLQALKDQLEALKSSAPPSRNDLDQLLLKIERATQEDRTIAFWRDVGLGFVFMVLGAILSYAIGRFTGQI